ncbi:MAG: Panacea domain-containing protein [Patescibacteria group bacterium]|nr:SocA family protein [Patescibacteria group bacterium]MBU2508764.1 SocA family protein [Patescibacteria group bacterium]
MPTIDVKKYESVILYLVKKLGGEIHGKKKLAKLLYYVDFDYFEQHETPVTGDSYKALPMGPFPEHMPEIIEGLVAERQITVESVAEREGYLPTEIYKIVSDKVDDTGLRADEKAMLDRVAEKYGNLTGKELETLSHSEAPYLGTEPNKEIAYELAFYRGTEF